MGWAVRRAFARAKDLALASAAGLGIFLAPHAVNAAPAIVASLTPQSTLLSAAQSAAQQTSWPTTGWPTAIPEAEGVDSSVLAQAIEQIRARRIPVNSLLIERHGAIVLDSYFFPFANNRPHNVYSVTKSVTSMLVGIAMAEHRLNDLNAPVLSLLPLQTDDPRKSRITLANLLSMTSGLDCRPEGGMSLLQQMLRSRHLAVFMMNRPEEAEPGTVFDYCGGNSEVVSAVLTQATGASAFEYARERLFTPLGITRVSWPTDADRVSHGWGDLELQPRDMAKLGYLWLHNGRWENKQIVPADYLAEALSRHINVQPGIDYGYGMWLYPGHTPVDFEANGSGGQRITVIPSLDVVEVTTGNGLDANSIAELIAPAFKADGSLPADTASDIRLASLSEDAALPAGAHSHFSSSTPQSLLKSAAPSEALIADNAVPTQELRVTVYPRPKPDLANRTLPTAVPIPHPKPLMQGLALAALVDVPVPRPKPLAPHAALVAQTDIPLPKPKPSAPHRAIVALSDVPIPRAKPRPTQPLDAAVAGIAEAPNAAANLRPLR